MANTLAMPVGTCGFPMSRSVLYRTLDVVEVQRTFYKPPRVETVKRWRQEAPPRFQFTIKAWQLVTHDPASPTYRRAGIDVRDRAGSYGHFRPTKEVFEAWEVMEEVCRAARAAAVVFQSPPSFKENRENVSNMREFFTSIDRPRPMCWEPRGGWSSSTIKDLCSTLELIHCVDPFVGPSLTGGKAYFRLHGMPPGKRRYHYTYSDDDLAELESLCREHKEVFLLFNNVTMYQDALRFREVAGV